MVTHDHDHGHGQRDVGEAGWAAQAEHIGLEGEVLLGFVTEAAAWISELRGGAAPHVKRILDVGSGPGIGSCELARRFPSAHVLALDPSPAMLERARLRIRSLGLDGRVEPRLAEVPGGLDGLEPVDVVWASMSLHHVGDEVGALAALRPVIAPGGVLALAERHGEMTVLPADLGFGPPGLVERLDRVRAQRFQDMRDALEGAVPSSDLASMLSAAGYEVAGERFPRLRLDPPLDADARRLVVGHVRRLAAQPQGRLDDDDLAALRILADPQDPRGVAQRPDVVVETSRHLVIARPAAPG
jgi:SAM-dependent methyltransferase